MPRAKVAKGAGGFRAVASLADFARGRSDHTQFMVETVKRGIVPIERGAYL